MDPSQPNTLLNDQRRHTLRRAPWLHIEWSSPERDQPCTGVASSLSRHTPTPSQLLSRLLSTALLPPPAVHCQNTPAADTAAASHHPDTPPTEEDDESDGIEAALARVDAELRLDMQRSGNLFCSDKFGTYVIHEEEDAKFCDKCQSTEDGDLMLLCDGRGCDNNLHTVSGTLTVRLSFPSPSLA